MLHSERSNPFGLLLGVTACLSPLHSPPSSRSVGFVVLGERLQLVRDFVGVLVEISPLGIWHQTHTFLSFDAVMINQPPIQK